MNLNPQSPPNLRGSRIVLAVNDLSASVDFYCNRLGFSIDVEYEGWSFLSRDGVRLMLGHCPDEVPASRIGDHSYIAYIDVQAIDALHAEFLSAGSTSVSPLQTQPWRMREFMITTPDGHRIMFGQDMDLHR